MRVFGQQRALDIEAGELQQQIETMLSDGFDLRAAVSVLLRVCLFLLRERAKQAL